MLDVLPSSIVTIRLITLKIRFGNRKYFGAFSSQDHSKIAKTVRFFTLPETALNIDRMA